MNDRRDAAAGGSPLPMGWPSALAGSTASISMDAAASSPSAIEFSAGNEIDGRYEIRGVLGTGGFSVVYRAWDRELQENVALKVLRSERLCALTLERFRREARIAREAKSRKLLRIFDIGRDRDTLYLPMELVEGETLKARLKRGALPVEEAVEIAMQILEGLEDLHGLGIVHRDVKPSNVLLGPGGSVKLADFGLALRLDDSRTRLTRTDALIGTIEYLSPEQALGEAVDARADLYSFGVLLFEMLTRHLPHQRQSSLGTLVARLGERAPDVRRLRADVPRWLANVVARLLQSDRRHRYDSARAVREDFGRRRAARSPARMRRGAVAIGVAATLALGSVAAGVLMSRDAASPSHFSRLTRVPGGVAGVSPLGETLWTRPTVGNTYPVLARLRPRGPQRVVGVFTDDENPDRPSLRRLTILDPATGLVEREVSLPTAASHFPGFSDRFGALIEAIDLDADGGDEILITRVHDPYWPSYLVLFEPLINRVRLLFVGSGHHYVAGARDVDGDGRREILLLGINNRMGWYNALTAVSVRPWVNTAAERPVVPVVSPDRSSASMGHAPLWYSLLPSGLCMDRRRCLDAGDGGSDPLRVRLDDGQEVALDTNGFVLGSGDRDPERRQHARHDAYRRLAEAERLHSAGFRSEPVTEAEASVAAAEEAGDPYLLEWVLRTRARLLIEAGAGEEAENAFLALMGSYERSSIAFDAAKAFHLRGDLERAIHWYREGLGLGGSYTRGRVKNEFLQGLVLALGEAGRWSEARLEVARFGAAYPHQSESARTLEEYVTWRSGESPRIERLAIGPSANDFDRYLLLEFRLARAESLEALHAAVEEELARSSESVPLLLGLAAEILSRLGRSTQAAEAAQRADGLARSARETDFVVRALFDVVAERRARISGR